MLSKVADSLYWMSRYLERAEHQARLIDVYLNQIPDLAAGLAYPERQAQLLESLGIAPESVADVQDEALLQRVTFDRELPTSIISYVTLARENARQVREQISSEMWTHINRLYLALRTQDQIRHWYTQPHDFYAEVKEGAHLFQGITDSTMNHNQGWHFIQIGRYLERTMSLVALLGVHLHSDTLNWHDPELLPDRYFELLAVLKSATAFEAYCKVYNADLKPGQIAEFLLFDSEFPRSARFCMEQVHYSLGALAEAVMLNRNHRLKRIAGRLQSSLSYDDMGDVLSTDYYSYLENIKQQVKRIHDTLYDTYITYDIEAALK